MSTRFWYWVALVQVLLLAVQVQATPFSLAMVERSSHNAVSRTVKQECHTNAECLAAGLPLLKPSPRRMARRGSNTFAATMPIVAVPAGGPAPNASPVKRSSIMERAQKRSYGAPPANSFGYLSAITGNSATASTTTQDITEAIQVSFDTTTSGVQLLEVVGGSVTQYLCMTATEPEIDTEDNTMDLTSFTRTVIAYCDQAGQPNAYPADTSISNSPATWAAESYIWSVDTQSGLLSAYWTNPEGTSPAGIYLQPAFYGDQTSGSIGTYMFTGSYTNYNDQEGGDLSPMDLYVLFPPS
ncbi:hypothetical protein BD324DRAFT_630381 [Kockovaella imperatae]|uniref:Uncharacterized protein n=1 Tax=Kockovaella imperatae TaxID=4999 RepID=A0A1Y1UDN7_9TREE|nr:hypothetical protein BD324DRAFT_630381 [Kockovaella imperatae]ORX36151.1 hypothetical protein BD324DRAFT_630381 [Kockovaella imperatae]